MFPWRVGSSSSGMRDPRRVVAHMIGASQPLQRDMTASPHESLRGSVASQARPAGVAR